MLSKVSERFGKYRKINLTGARPNAKSNGILVAPLTPPLHGKEISCYDEAELREACARVVEEQAVKRFPVYKAKRGNGGVCVCRKYHHHEQHDQHQRHEQQQHQCQHPVFVFVVLLTDTVNLEAGKEQQDFCTEIGSPEEHYLVDSNLNVVRSAEILSNKTDQDRCCCYHPGSKSQQKIQHSIDSGRDGISLPIATNSGIGKVRRAVILDGGKRASYLGFVEETGLCDNVTTSRHNNPVTSHVTTTIPILRSTAQPLSTSQSSLLCENSLRDIETTFVPSDKRTNENRSMSRKYRALGSLRTTETAVAISNKNEASKPVSCSTEGEVAKPGQKAAAGKKWGQKVSMFGRGDEKISTSVVANACSKLSQIRKCTTGKMSQIIPTLRFFWN